MDPFVLPDGKVSKTHRALSSKATKMGWAHDNVLYKTMDTFVLPDGKVSKNRASLATQRYFKFVES
jgi:hypothetical protein